MDRFHHVGYYGYHFIQRAVTEYARKRRETDSRRFIQQNSSRHSALWNWFKKRLIVLTFISLIVSGILCIVSTHWQTNQVAMKISSTRNFQPIEIQYPTSTHAHHPSIIGQSIIAGAINAYDWRLTNASLSTFKIVTQSKDIKAGKNVTISIQSRNGKDEELRTGGDFWLVTVYWTSTPKASCAGKVTDHNNGTYSVNFYVVRAGLAQIHIILVHPRKAVDLLKTQIWNTEKRIYWLGKYEQDGSNYWSNCFVSREVEGDDTVCLYGNPDALGDTVFVCRKPRGSSCDELTHTIVNQDMTRHRILALTGDKIYYFERTNYWNKVTKGPKMLYVKSEQIRKSGRVSTKVRPLPPCNQPPAPSTSSNGYWLSDQWHSLICNSKQWKLHDIGQCLRGRHLIILGDSSLRQWVKALHILLGAQYIKQEHERLSSDHHIESLDFNITFRFHPQVISGAPVDVNMVEYEVDIIDSLIETENCNFIITLGPWAHFSQWTRESYIERLLLLRLSIARLRQKCPYVPVVVKGSHPREHDTIESVIYSSDLILHELGEIMQNVFSDSETWFMNVWEMVLSYPKENDIHLPNQIVKQELNMFLSHVCHQFMIL